jgi:hypothetical protein
MVALLNYHTKEIMKLSKYHKLLLVFAITSNTVCIAQNVVVQEKVITPLLDPAGTNYSAKSFNIHIGYETPFFNTNQSNTLFWKSGGYHMSLASQIALNKRIGFGYQIGYTRVHYGKTTNDSLGTTFFSERSVTSTNLLDLTLFTRLFLGETYYKPSIDLGIGVNYNFSTRILQQGTYVPTNTSGGLKYKIDPNQQYPMHAMLRVNMEKFYISGKYWFSPLFKEQPLEIKWQTQLGIGMRF